MRIHRTKRMNIKFTLNVKLSLDDDLMDLITRILDEGIKVAESPEVTQFRARVDTALTSVSTSLASQSESISNVAADIQRLIDGGIQGLSPEDKAALEAIGTSLEATATAVSDTATALADVAAIVPEPPSPEGRNR